MAQVGLSSGTASVGTLPLKKSVFGSGTVVIFDILWGWMWQVPPGVVLIQAEGWGRGGDGGSGNAAIGGGGGGGGAYSRAVLAVVPGEWLSFLFGYPGGGAIDTWLMRGPTILMQALRGGDVVWPLGQEEGALGGAAAGGVGDVCFSGGKGSGFMGDLGGGGGSSAGPAANGIGAVNEAGALAVAGGGRGGRGGDNGVLCETQFADELLTPSFPGGGGGGTWKLGPWGFPGLGDGGRIKVTY